MSGERKKQRHLDEATSSGIHARESLSSSSDKPLGFAEGLYPENGGELFFAFVCPLGTDEQAVMDQFEIQLMARDYEVVPIKLSDLIRDHSDQLSGSTPDSILDEDEESQLGSDEAKRIRRYQLLGNAIRQKRGGDVMARLACVEVARHRSKGDLEAKDTRPGRVAYVFRSLKHPDEAALLRTIYGHGFYLVAMHGSHEARFGNLKKRGLSDEEAAYLMVLDEKEDQTHGQNTRDTFELGDFFLNDQADTPNQVKRFVELLFRALYITPTKDEFGMFMASCSSQRSGDLSRQVGAAIFDDLGDLLSSGCNEVPKAGGGTYWPEDDPDVRDYRLGRDPNDLEKEERFEKLLEVLNTQANGAISREQLEKAWRESGLKDLTEFGRTVHAEMDAIMSAARRGVGLGGATLYATTFPCHNCARHIVASGIRRVVYIEPYAKSEAYALYGDSIKCTAHPVPAVDRPTAKVQVPFEAFVGVAPRRFADFFSMRHLTGRRIERKDSKGFTLPQRLSDLQTPRLQLSEFPYLEREELAIKTLPSETKGGVESVESS